MIADDLNPVPDEHLEFLNMWPKDVPFYNTEQCNLRLLNSLCRTYGYGRIPQLAAMLEELWRHPENLDELKKVRQKQLGVLQKERGLGGHPE